MNFFEKFKKAKGGYIFLSHSHDDIEKVREIRNMLEKEGFEPLCFYLKCLSDDSEIEDLIKREIDAREWFVFVNSENSRKSKWVTLEREYITQQDSNKIIEIKLDDESIKYVVGKITKNLRVFLSFAVKDYNLAHRIRTKLEEKDYLVYSGDDFKASSGEELMQLSQNAIAEASEEGCVIVLLTTVALRSEWIKQEVLFAIEQGKNIIPVMVGRHIKMDPVFREMLENVQHYYLQEHPSDEEIADMIELIGQEIVKKKK